MNNDDTFYAKAFGFVFLLFFIAAFIAVSFEFASWVYNWWVNVLGA